MTRLAFARYLLSPFDVVLAILIGVLCLLYFALKAAFCRGERDPRRVMSIATAPLFVADGDDVAGFSTYYVYPGSRRSVALYLDGAASERFVGRSLPTLIGMTLVDKAPQSLNKNLPITAIALREMLSVAKIVSISNRLAIGTLATFSPSRVTPRATLAAFLLGTRFVVKVFGNQMLLQHIKAPRDPTLVRSVVGWLEAAVATMLAQTVYRRADLVIGYNINNAASAISLGAHPAKTRMLRIRPHTATFAIERSQPRSDRQIVLWSRLSSEKATVEACAAAIKVLERNSAVTFLVIGDGTEREKLERMAEASTASDRIKFAGWMQREQLFRAVNGSSVALMPLGGYALLEAAMLGIPIVCFDIEWHNEVITHGVSGYLADYPDIDHMAQLIESIVNNPETGHQFANEARARVEAMFEPVQRTTDERRILDGFFKKAEEKT